MTPGNDLVPQLPGGSGALQAQQRSSEGAEPMRLRFIWGLIRRNSWIILGTAAACLGLAAYLTRGTVPLYSAAVSLRIDTRPSELPALDVLRSTAANEVNTEMGMLRSRTLAAAVAESLALQLRVIEPTNVERSEIFLHVRIDTTGGAAVPTGRFELTPVPNSTAMQLRAAASLESLATLKPGSHVRLGTLWFQLAPEANAVGPINFEVRSLDATVDQLLSDLDVTRPNREANLVQIRYQDIDKSLARDVPNQLANLFIAERRTERQSVTRNTAEFLSQQIAKLSAQLRTAEDSLQRFREKAEIVSLSTQASSGVSHEADLQAQRNDLDAERAALAKLLDDASRAAQSRGQTLSPYQSFLGFPSFLRNQAVGTLLSSLKAADDRRAELLTRRQPQDPDVLQLDARVKELEGQLQSVAQTYLAGLSNQVQALDATLQSSRRELSRIPAKEAQFARLERSVKGLEEIVLQLRSRLKETEVAQVANDETVRLIDVASVPRAPLRSRRPLILAFACCVGLTLGLGAGLVREYLNTSVQTQMDVESATGIPIIGWIPRIQGHRARRLAASTSATHATSEKGGGPTPGTTVMTRRSRLTPTGVLMSRNGGATPLSDAYEQVLTSLLFSRTDGEIRSVAITSGLPGEGKTTNATNLAVTLAQGGRRVILVDADLRRGRLAKLFGAAREPGLVNLLEGSVSLESALRWVEVGGGRHMYLLPTGRLPTNPAQLLGTTAMRELLDRLRAESDIVILDCPPLNIVADAVVVGRLVDGLLLVVRLGATPFDSLVHTAEQLRAAKINVFGTLLNDIRFDRAVRYDEGLRWYEYAKSYYARAEPD